jgi:hypothetical protein
MSVNISKTKVVIFNKSGRFIKQNFQLNNTVLDCCNSYKYLGITFSSSGSFTESKTELYKKAVKAFSNWKQMYYHCIQCPKLVYISLTTLSNLLYYTVQKYGVVIYQNQLTLTLCLTIQDYHLYFPVINYIFIFVNIYTGC